MVLSTAALAVGRLGEQLRADVVTGGFRLREPGAGESESLAWCRFGPCRSESS